MNNEEQVPLVLHCAREIKLWDAAVIAALSIPGSGAVALVADAVVLASRLRRIEYPVDNSPY